MLALARMIPSGERASRLLACSRHQFHVTPWRTKALRGAESRQGGRFVCPAGGSWNLFKQPSLTHEPC